MRCMRTNRGSSSTRGIKHVNRTQHALSASKKRKLHSKHDTDEDHQREGCSNGSDRRKTVGINDLPHQVLGRVLSNLSPVERLRAESVCRRWKFVGVNFGWTNQRELSVKEMLHSSSVMHSATSMSKPLTNKHIEVLLKRCGRSLRLLNIGSLSTVNRDNITYAVCSLLVHVPLLHSLDLSGVQLTNSALSSLGFRLPNLKRAAFRNSFKNTRMERGLSSFLTNCKRLTHLDLSVNENLIGIAFSELPSSLEELNISYCFHVGVHSVRQIRANCVNLRRLYIDQIGDSVPIRELDEMLRGLKSLVYLKFCDCYGSSEFNELQPNQNDHNLTGIGEMTNLTELHVNENRLVNDDVLRAISFGCHSLQFLDISQSQRGITDAGLRHLSQLPNLTTLKMSGQRMVSDESLILIARRGILKELTVSRCTQITSESVLQTIKHCKSLQSLDVSYCVGVTQIIFAELSKAMERRHGKSQPSRHTRPDDKFRLTICRSGIQGNVPSHSPWIHLVDYPPNSENPMTSNAVFITAHNYFVALDIFALVQMDGLHDNKKLHDFGLQVQQLLGSELHGFVNINNLKWEMKNSFGFDVDEKAEEFGYDAFEDMLNSNVLNNYVEIERERIGEGGQMQTRYKAKQDRNTSAVHREQMIFHRDKERKEARRLRLMEQHFDATVINHFEEMGKTAAGGRSFRPYYGSQQQPPTHHFHHPKAHSPSMEMNGALDSNWYTTEDTDEVKEEEVDREEGSDSGVDTKAKGMKMAASDYSNFYGAPKSPDPSDNNSNNTHNQQAKSSTAKKQQQRQLPSQVGGVLEWSSDEQQQPNDEEEEREQGKQKQQQQLQQQRSVAKSKFVGISSWPNVDQPHSHQQQKQPQKEAHSLLQHHVAAAQKSVKLINFSSSDDEDDDGRSSINSRAAARRTTTTTHKLSNDYLEQRQQRKQPPLLVRPVPLRTQSVAVLKKIIWSEDEEDADQSKEGKDVSSENIGKNKLAEVNAPDREPSAVAPLQQCTPFGYFHAVSSAAPPFLRQPPAMFAPLPLPTPTTAAGTSAIALTSNGTCTSAGFVCPPVDSNPAHWSAKALCRWLTEAGFADCAQRLLNEEVDGASLLLFSPVHYQNLGLKLGPMVKLQQVVEYLRQFTLADARASKQ